jgi:hypothetical protein
MVFLQGILKPVQDLCKLLSAYQAKNEPPKVDDVQKCLALAQKVARVIHKRTFVVMTAQTFGRSFANELDFYQQSTLRLFYLHFSRVF